MELLINGTSAGHKILLFSQFTSMLEIIAKRLKKEKIPFYLLTGSTPARERRGILEGLQAGDIALCIGTHALLTEDVQYHRLGLVITDEQHRFGVDRRWRSSDRPQLRRNSSSNTSRRWAWPSASKLAGKWMFS